MKISYLFLAAALLLSAETGTSVSIDACGVVGPGNHGFCHPPVVNRSF